MKKLTPVLLMIFLFAVSVQGQESYNNLWNTVHKLEVENRTKSALKVVEDIYKKAKKNNNSSQLIKSLLYKSKFALTLEEDAQLSIIHQFKEHIATSESPRKNILQNITANLYWQFFNQNRWKFYSRTKTATKVDPKDFRTWDIQTLFTEIHKYYQASLENKKALQKVDIYTFSDILEVSENTKILQPTLFDFLAYNALEFYTTPETSIHNPKYQFKLEDPKLISDIVEFSKLEITSKDNLSLQFHALKIFQEISKFHLQSKNYDALVNLDLQRLAFVKQYGSFFQKEKLLLATLEASKKRFQKNAISGLYAFKIAKTYHELANSYKPKKEEANRFKNKEAIAICKEIQKKFPNSDGAKQCAILEQKITAPSLQILAEKNTPIDTYSRVLVQYKNVENLHFFIYPINFEQYQDLQPLYDKEAQYRFIKKLPLKESWTTSLKNEKDFQRHATEKIIPKLEAGNYIIVASTKKDWTSKTTFAFSKIQITNIALIQNQEKSNNYQVVNRNTGAPLVNAKVHLTNKVKNHYDKSIDLHFVTDKNGEFSFFPEKQYYRNVYAEITHKEEKAYLGNFYINPRYRNNRNDNKEQIETFLFTDRSIYRPGQTVYFKGISMRHLKNSATIITDEAVSVVLKDVNSQVIKELNLKTNDFGSFSSNFSLPSQILNGQFVIETSIGKKKNYTYIAVEEYKRPKFETAYKPVTVALKINDKVTINGFAKSYSGIPITDAKVVYRVHRKVQYPRWWYWYRPQYIARPQEIISGTTNTDISGNFTINFDAIPDENIPQKDLPVFVYEITADVTDINGETQSTTMDVKVGYHTMLADIDFPSDIDKEEQQILKINTTNLNGKPIPSTGELFIYKLNAPARILRERPWSAPDYQTISKKEFTSKFPNDAYSNEDDFKNWEKGKLVYQSNFNTNQTNELKITDSKKWKSGKYIVLLKSKDKYGKEVTAKHFFTAFSTSDKLPIDNTLVTVKTDKNSYQPGDKVQLSVSSNSKDISLVVFIEKNKETIEKHFISLQKNTKKITIPVTKDDLGGFGVRWYYVQYNAFAKGNLTIAVPYPPTDLHITTNTFRDKLTPGEKQTWSFTIKGPKKDNIAAELLASMYDASLDAFKPHQWNFKPIKKPIYVTRNNANAGISFGNSNFLVMNQDIPPYLNTIQNPKVNYKWFGFSFTGNRWVNDQYIRNLTFQKTKFDASISGKVINKKGYPVPFVNIKIKGTNFGTTADVNGRFTINISKGDMLITSFIGYKSVETSTNTSGDLKIVLEESTDNMGGPEIAYGIAAGAPRSSRAQPNTAFAKGRMQESMMVEDLQEVEEVSADAINKEKVSKPSFKGQIRKNLQETAFFYPNIRTDKNGNISFNFTAPEALTKWKLQLLGHTKELYSMTKTLETVTQKNLIVTPNAPRFLRHGDRITIRSKISNLSKQVLNGTAKLILTDPISGKEIHQLHQDSSTQPFTVDPKNNTQVSWTLNIPETIEALQYKVIADAGDFSDGEQNALPVLTNRILVTETLPLWTKGSQSKTFALQKLQNNSSGSLKNHQLTLEITSNPAWYAVQALPYLMEYPYACSEQIFSKYYANILAGHIANSNARIQEVFQQWRNSEAMLSNLEKNEELKSIIIQESPWVREAQSEAEQKKRIALLFDLNTLQNEQQVTLEKLKQMQLQNGAFPWFKGGIYPNIYITQHIASGFGHLKHLGIQQLDGNIRSIVKKAVGFMDNEILDIHQKLLQNAKRIKEKDGEKKAEEYLNKKHISNFTLHYLYMRSFHMDIPVKDSVQKAIAYYLKQSATYWIDFDLYGKGLIALVQHRKGNTKLASKILLGLKENSIVSEELGMYWKSNKSGWGWFQAPIETQALLIEAFSEIEKDTETIDNLKIWLLKNKQVGQWKTTKATTEAVYALLLQGSDWISVTDVATVSVGNKTISPTSSPTIGIEAGTGYFKTSWKGDEITPKMAKVRVESKGKSIVWGGLYWQYFEDLDKITAANTPLKLTKKLFKKTNSDRGKTLVPLTKDVKLAVGDVLTTRIELRVDRNMEFIHMKDLRASGVEPLDVLSGYKWQDGLGYYQSTKDASTNFFFDSLPKGVYVFEYDVRVNNAGKFSNGITTIQSMYAPEFSSHSKGTTIEIE